MKNKILIYDAGILWCLTGIFITIGVTIGSGIIGFFMAAGLFRRISLVR